jgi:dolichyl-phosphate beta-glucosyltransferase
MSPAVSLILPAYNEALRLPPYLRGVRTYLDATFPANYEILIVDDGSTDDMADRLEALRGDWPSLVLLRHAPNRGKGAALRTGMAAACGELMLFADADGATPIQETSTLCEAIEQGADVAVGSRFLPEPAAAVRRFWHRHLSGRCFAGLVRWGFGLPLRDTQCGFKMFRREVVLRLLPLCRESGYLFDLEILVWAHRLGYRIAEVPVSWRDVPGSKVRLLRDGWAMLRGLLRLRRALGRVALPQQSAPLTSAPVSDLLECKGGAGFPSLDTQGR